MNPATSDLVFRQLDSRRAALNNAIAQVGQAPDLIRLLGDVDQALRRLRTKAFGQCIVCDGRMDDDEMVGFPMRQYCLCALSSAQRKDLQRDLDLAWKVQASLLPAQDSAFAGWQSHFRYVPAGPVSGDYVDVIANPNHGNWVYFLIGDVSGKGIAASYIMAHLNHLVRRVLQQPVSVSELISTVNDNLQKRAPDPHFFFVTLVAGRAHASGRIEIANAGHCRPIVLRHGESFEVSSGGLPAGVAPQSETETTVLQLDVGESLLLYTDGITEALGPQDQLYGAGRLRQTAFNHRQQSPALLAAACLADVHHFRASAPPQDDTTLLLLRRMVA